MSTADVRSLLLQELELPPTPPTRLPALATGTFANRAVLLKAIDYDESAQYETYAGNGWKTAPQIRRCFGFVQLQVTDASLILLDHDEIAAPEREIRVLPLHHQPPTTTAATTRATVTMIFKVRCLTSPSTTPGFSPILRIVLMQGAPCWLDHLPGSGGRGSV